MPEKVDPIIRMAQDFFRRERRFLNPGEKFLIPEESRVDASGNKIPRFTAKERLRKILWFMVQNGGQLPVGV
jgi:hypothetical protein